MREAAGVVFVYLIAFAMAPGSAFGQTIRVKESIAGTNLSLDVDINGDGEAEGQLGLCYGKGTFGEYHCKTYGETFLEAIGPGEPCEPGWLYAVMREFDPQTGAQAAFGHIQEFKNGDLLYWVIDWSKTSYYCIDMENPGQMTLKGYLKYDGGTGRFENATGTVEWNFDIDTRIPHYLWGVEGRVEGLLTLQD
jgi:hypothetical protein